MLPEQFDAIAPHRPQIVHHPQNFPGVIETVSDFFARIENFARGNRAWWLRGEPRLFPQPCLPAFSRSYCSYGGEIAENDPCDLELAEEQPIDAAGNSILTTCLTTQELAVVRDFQRHAPRDEFFERMVGSDENDPGWLIFAQHYGMPTRMLDVTSDPLVALYFACANEEDEAGFVWLYAHPMNAHGPHRPTDLLQVFNPAIRDSMALAYHAEGRISEYRSRTEISGLIDANFLYDFESPNRRVLAQRGKFIWAGSPLWHLARNVFGFEIPAESKRTIMDQIGPYGITVEGLCLE